MEPMLCVLSNLFIISVSLMKVDFFTKSVVTDRYFILLVEIVYIMFLLTDFILTKFYGPSYIL